jgi:exodeoxyribonuclease VII small subunit
MAKKLSYKDAVEEIEQIISKIEDDEYSIDEIAEKVKRISFLINYCKEKLRTTEDELDKILKKMQE